MEEEKINLTLAVVSANKILEALGNMPFRDVHQLIRDIQMQAQKQLKPENKKTDADST